MLVHRDMPIFLSLYLSVDSQESVGGTVHRATVNPLLELPAKMPRLCCPVEIFLFFGLHLEI